MSLNNTPAAERVHIGFYGLRNAGKSSLVNAVTGQKLSLVSEVKGTTTDPVKKTMELLPLGPVVIIDTPGMDDEGELGAQRVARAKEMLSQTDIAVLVVDAARGLSPEDQELIALFEAKKTPYLTVFNKADLLESIPAEGFYVSAETGLNIYELKEKLAAMAPKEEKKLLADLVTAGDTVVLVIPIDESAPKGRLILPQQHTIRELLELGVTIVCSQHTNLQETLEKLKTPPKLVITDSQVFGFVSKIVPKKTFLTSFSILFARFKGSLSTVVSGAAMLSKLKDGDKILISEGCTHHRQCQDIGTVKLPGWIEKYTGVKPEFHFTSGAEFPEDPSDFALVIHCGGCMLNEKEMKSRLARCKQQGIPVTNYGIAIAQLHGILKRSVEPFPAVYELLK
ncbi:MAG: [Clostridia bacterium]|nr:[FeFe] hydrogenase H-cluster maturation GTPase HydF [Clostridia bacterium]